MVHIDVYLRTCTTIDGGASENGLGSSSKGNSKARLLKLPFAIGDQASPFTDHDESHASNHGYTSKLVLSHEACKGNANPHVEEVSGFS